MRQSIWKSYLSSPRLCIKHSSYFDVYDDLLGKFRGKEITFIEIGVLGGGSLHMWRNFFGPKARIIGIDLNPEAQLLTNDGFEIIIGNQADPEFWASPSIREILSQADVVLDDGGHNFSAQYQTLVACSQHMPDKSMLIVEDTHSSYMREFGIGGSFVSHCKKLIDAINARSGVLKAKEFNQSIYEMRFFESIVAFTFDRSSMSTKSHPVSNQSASNPPEDYRHSGIRLGKGKRKNHPVINSKSLRLGWHTVRDGKINALGRIVFVSISNLRTTLISNKTK